MSIKTIFLILAVFLVPVGLAQDLPLSALDMARASEVWRVIETHGRAVWSDWLPPPQLLRKADADYLIGHPNPPKDFAPVSGIQIAGQAVYKRSGHLLPVPAATTWLVADVWVLAIPTLEEFQQAIDQVLGIGVVQFD